MSQKIKKYIRENPKRVLKISIIFVVVSTLLFVLAMAQLIKENSQCVENPFTYAANRVQVTSDRIGIAAESGPVCSCDLGPTVKFYFDKEGIYQEDPRYSKLDLK